jgi:hypothetical protein
VRGGQHQDGADVRAIYKVKPFEGHKANFYRCIREGGLPVSDVYSHIIAMNTCHLAAIAARLLAAIATTPDPDATLVNLVAVSDSLGGKASQVRVVQGKEPLHFRLLFKGLSLHSRDPKRAVVDGRHLDGKNRGRAYRVGQSCHMLDAARTAHVAILINRNHM